MTLVERLEQVLKGMDMLNWNPLDHSLNATSKLYMVLNRSFLYNKVSSYMFVSYHTEILIYIFRHLKTQMFQVYRFSISTENILEGTASLRSAMVGIK